MQEPVPQSTFCQICRHPTGVGDGHYKNCPVYTGEPVAGVYQSGQQGGTVFSGYPTPAGVNPQDLQPYPQSQEAFNMIQRMAGLVAPAQGPAEQLQAAARGELGVYGMNPDMLRQGQIPREDGYEVAKIYREARERLLEELRLQVEVNCQLSRELIDLRLDYAGLQSRFDEVVRAAQTPPPKITAKPIWDDCPF